LENTRKKRKKGRKMTMNVVAHRPPPSRRTTFISSVLSFFSLFITKIKRREEELAHKGQLAPHEPSGLMGAFFLSLF